MPDKVEESDVGRLGCRVFSTCARISPPSLLGHHLPRLDRQYPLGIKPCAFFIWISPGITDHSGSGYFIIHSSM